MGLETNQEIFHTDYPTGAVKLNNGELKSVTIARVNGSLRAETIVTSPCSPCACDPSTLVVQKRISYLTSDEAEPSTEKTRIIEETGQKISRIRLLHSPDSLRFKIATEEYENGLLERRSVTIRNRTTLDDEFQGIYFFYEGLLTFAEINAFSRRKWKAYLQIDCTKGKPTRITKLEPDRKTGKHVPSDKSIAQLFGRV